MAMSRREIGCLNEIGANNRKIAIGPSMRGTGFVVIHQQNHPCVINQPNKHG